MVGEIEWERIKLGDDDCGVYGLAGDEGLRWQWEEEDGDEENRRCWECGFSGEGISDFEHYLIDPIQQPIVSSNNEYIHPKGCLNGQCAEAQNPSL